MNLNKILKEMGSRTDKSWTYLKGIFNTANSEYHDQFGDALADDKKMIMALIKVGKKYDLDRTDVEKIINNNIVKVSEEDKKLAGEIEDMFVDEEDTLTITDDPNHGEVDVSSGSPSAWKRFLKAIPDPEVPFTEFEKTPSLIVEIGPTFYLKMVDLENGPPDPVEMTGQWGPYDMYPFKVIFLKVSDEDLYDVQYKSGNFKGEDAYIKKRKYTFWINEKSLRQFRLFWEQITKDGVPDDRVFTYKFGKKGKYNVYTYGLPKKRD